MPTPFHNMALMSPATTEADVGRHTGVFEAAVAKVLGWQADLGAPRKDPSCRDPSRATSAARVHLRLAGGSVIGQIDDHIDLSRLSLERASLVPGTSSCQLLVQALLDAVLPRNTLSAEGFRLASTLSEDGGHERYGWWCHLSAFLSCDSRLFASHFARTTHGSRGSSGRIASSRATVRLIFRIWILLMDSLRCCLRLRSCCPGRGSDASEGRCWVLRGRLPAAWLVGEARERRTYACGGSGWRYHRSTTLTGRGSAGHGMRVHLAPAIRLVGPVLHVVPPMSCAHHTWSSEIRTLRTHKHHN